MARQKSEQVRQAILDAAHTLFLEKGYIATTISAIARSANTSQSNVYVYFASKIEIAFAVFDPWMRAKMIELESNVGATRGAEAKLEAMVTGLLNGIAADHSGQTVEQIEKDSDRDRWFTAEEAREYGLIDFVYSTDADAPGKKGSAK